MKLTTPMSCRRHARTTFSLWPALSAWVALCRRWAVEAKRCLKKSISCGLSGIFGSRGSAPMRKYLPGFAACSAAPLSISTLPSPMLNSTDLVAIFSLSSCIIRSSSSSACSDMVSGLVAASCAIGMLLPCSSALRLLTLRLIVQRDLRLSTRNPVRTKLPVLATIAHTIYDCTTGIVSDAAYRSLRRLADLRHALGPGPGRRRRELQHRGLGIPLHRRPLRLRQVYLAQHHRGLFGPQRGGNPHRRQGRHRPRPRSRRGVPGLRPAVSVAHRARQRDLRTGDEGDGQGRAR